MTVILKNSTITKEPHHFHYAKLLDKILIIKLQLALGDETTLNTTVVDFSQLFCH